jgi:hypothetical protein
MTNRQRTFGLAWSGLTWPGLFWLGLAWPGLVWLGRWLGLGRWLWFGVSNFDLPKADSKPPQSNHHLPGAALQPFLFK